MLPDLDGLEVCRRLRAAPATARVPIVFLTARTDEAMRVRGLALGADDYVVKPFSTQELLLRDSRRASARDAASRCGCRRSGSACATSTAS